MLNAKSLCLVVMRFKVYCFELVLRNARWFDHRLGGIFYQCMESVPTQRHEEFG